MTQMQGLGQGQGQCRRKRSSQRQAFAQSQGQWLPVLVVLALLLLSSLPASTADFCGAAYRKLQAAPRYTDEETGVRYAVVRPSDLAPCTRRAALSQGQQVRDISSVQAYLEQFYPLLHVAKDSPNPQMPSKYDLVAYLETLKAKSYASAADFYGDLALAVRGLSDGATQVMVRDAPVYTLAVNVVVIQAGGVPSVRVAPAYLQGKAVAAVANKGPFFFDQTRFHGALVATIDKNEAWSALANWAKDNKGTYLSPVQRLNSAFAGLKWADVPGKMKPTLSYRPGDFSVRTTNPGMHVEMVIFGGLAGGLLQIVKVPWLAGVPLSSLSMYKNEHAIRAAYTTPGPVPPVLVTRNADSGTNASASANALLRAAGASAAGAKMNMQKPGDPASGRYRVPFQRAPLRFAKMVSGPNDFWPVYKMTYSAIGIVAFPTFNVKSLDKRTDDAFFMQETTKAFNTLKRYTVTRVIIDLQSNPGGNIKYAYWLLEMLLGSQRFQPRNRVFLRFLADKSLPKALVAAAKGPWSYTGYSNSIGVPFTSATRSSFFNPVTKLTLGGSGEPGFYSSLAQENIQSLRSLTGKIQEPILGTRRLMFFSDGLCFGACGTLAAIMKRKFGGNLVTIGGLPFYPFIFGGGGGGFGVQDVGKELLPLWSGDSALRNQPGTPQAFVGPITMSLKISVGFINRNTSALPLDFQSFWGSKVYYNMGNLADLSLMYTAAANYFPK